MKKLKLIIGLAALASMTTMAEDTTNNVVATNISASVWSSIESYFTAFNTNLDGTYAETKTEIWSGMSYQSGVTVGADFGLSYQIYTFDSTNGTGLTVETVNRLAEVKDTILSSQGGVGWNLPIHDVQFTVYVDGGYDWDEKCCFGETGIRFKKALSKNLFAGVGVGARFADDTPKPVESIFAGVKF